MGKANSPGCPCCTTSGGTLCGGAINVCFSIAGCSADAMTGVTISVTNGTHTYSGTTTTGSLCLSVLYGDTYTGTVSYSGYTTATFTATYTCGVTPTTRSITLVPDATHCCSTCCGGIIKTPLYFTDSNGTWPLTGCGTTYTGTGSVSRNILSFSIINCPDFLFGNLRTPVYSCTGGTLSYSIQVACVSGVWSGGISYFRTGGASSGCPPYTTFVHCSCNTLAACFPTFGTVDQDSGTSSGQAINATLTGSCGAGSVMLSGTLGSYTPGGSDTPTDGDPVAAGSTVTVHD